MGCNTNACQVSVLDHSPHRPLQSTYSCNIFCFRWQQIYFWTVGRVEGGGRLVFWKIFKDAFSQKCPSLDKSGGRAVEMAETQILISQGNFSQLCFSYFKSAFPRFWKIFFWDFFEMFKLGKESREGWYGGETNFNFPREFNSRLCLIHQLLTSIYFKGNSFSNLILSRIYFTQISLFFISFSSKYFWRMTLSPTTVSSVQLPASESCENQQSLQTSQTNRDYFLAKSTWIFFGQPRLYSVKTSQDFFCQKQPRFFLSKPA